ncbi:MAG: DUF4268 domain-containing protein [Actinomycetota bacterium]|jgi:hypothetical protein|nr:DUF4268 domain-containing protein [Actinomycetota bacterium]
MELFNIFSAFGLSASAGLNAYIPLLVVSLLAKYTTLIKLGSPWDAMTSWWVIGVLIFLTIIEVLADKIPAINHINDTIQSFIRPTAGAIVFAASASNISQVNPILAIVAGLFIAGSVSAVKSLAVRPTVTATTGGAANLPVSFAEDVTSTSVSILSVILPVVAVVLFLIIAAIVITIIVKRKRNKKRFLFWKKLLDKSKDKTNLFSDVKPLKSAKLSTKPDKKGLIYSFIINQKFGAVELFIEESNPYVESNKNIHGILKAEKDSIEKEFGDSLEWEHYEKRKATIIRKKYSVSNLKKSATWDELQDQMINGMIKLEKAITEMYNLAN